MRSRTLFVSAALLWLAAGIAAQNPQQPPTFRGGIELVTVDVAVVDGNNRPVRDLKAEDFTVTVDGEPRRIASVQFIEQMKATDAPASPPTVTAPPAYAGNEGLGPGRLIVLVPDLDHIARGAGGVVLKTLATFLDRLSAADRVALVPLGGGEPKVDFTKDLSRIRTALERASGRRSPTSTRNRVSVGVSEAFDIVDRQDQQVLNAVIDRECLGFGDRADCPKFVREEAVEVARTAHNDTRQALAALANLVEALGKLQGTKTIVLLSEGFAFTQQELTEFRRVAASAARARVAIYTLALDAPVFEASARKAEPAAASDGDLRTQSLDTVAGMTRGTRFNVTATGAGVFDRLMTELSGYYLLSFEPAGNDRDGKTHRIGVKASRANVTVRARQEFAFTPRPTYASARDRIGNILREPLLATELPLRLIVYGARGDGSKIKLIIAAEIDRAATTPSRVDLGFTIADGTDKIVADAFEEATVPPVEAGRPSPRVHITAATVDAGRYTVKFATVDDSGRGGSAEMSVDARLTNASPLTTSDLMLGAILGGRFRPRAVTPRGTSLTTYLELYASNEADWAGIDITVEITPAAGGAPLIRERVAVQPSADARRRIAIGTLPVALAPGDYVTRARITKGGGQIGEVTRLLRVTE